MNVSKINTFFNSLKNGQFYDGVGHYSYADGYFETAQSLGKMFSDEYNNIKDLYSPQVLYKILRTYESKDNEFLFDSINNKYFIEFKTSPEIHTLGTNCATFHQSSELGKFTFLFRRSDKGMSIIGLFYTFMIVTYNYTVYCKHMTASNYSDIQIDTMAFFKTLSVLLFNTQQLVGDTRNISDSNGNSHTEVFISTKSQNSAYGLYLCKSEFNINTIESTNTLRKYALDAKYDFHKGKTSSCNLPFINYYGVDFNYFLFLSKSVKL